ncbi:MAG: imidazole glycerol phosphate synthase cyclase subunit [Candidatus Omnitrophica bacterium]|nr:imidazole glycerol phosphate synthase cyclase subunit [Candidatus Omnitrophota bacterium]
MLKIRLIPIFLLKNGFLVRSENFKTHQIIGNPINEVQRFNQWNVDELIYLDISREESYETHRGDHKIAVGANHFAILDAVSKTCFMPLTWGGLIKTVEDMRERFARGADKITINTAALNNPGLISQGAKMFGSQAIVVSMDVFRHDDGVREVFTDRGHKPTGIDPKDWAHKAEELGAGEILLQSINNDGIGTGYDLDLIHSVSSAVKIPVIACSGVGTYEHYVEGVRAGASAVAAANIWHFKELTDRNGKRALLNAKINVRV